MGKRIFGALLLSLALAAGMASVAGAAEKTPRGAPPGGVDVKAPDFTLRDLQGKTFRLGDQRGKPVLLFFTTTWCGYCREEIPHFKKIHETYGKQGLVVVNVDIQEPRDRVARYAEKYQLPYRVLLDVQGDVAGVYEVVGVPSLILVNAEGMIVCRQCRSVDTLLEGLFKTK